MVNIACFDMGSKNFAEYVEELSDNDLANLRSIENIEEVCGIGKRIHFGVYNFRDEENNAKWTNNERIKLFQHLDDNLKLWKSCEYIGIEQQFYSEHSGQNIDAIKISEAVVSFFLMKVPKVEVVFIQSSRKTQLFGARDGARDNLDIKKWSVDNGIFLLSQRENERFGLKLAKKKLFDVYDGPNRVTKTKKVRNKICEEIEGLDIDEELRELLTLHYGAETKQKLDDVFDCFHMVQILKQMKYCISSEKKKQKASVIKRKRSVSPTEKQPQVPATNKLIAIRVID